MANRRALVVLFFFVVSCWSYAGEPFGEPTVTGKVSAKPISEASGLAVSLKQPGVLWTHNDSGDKPRVYAIHKDGRLLGTYTLKNAIAFDYEAMSLGPGPEQGVHYLYAGDIGNNDAHRGKPRIHITLYRFSEPKVDVAVEKPVKASVDVDQLVMRYPDGAHDAEVLMVDPTDGAIYILSKRDPKSRIYRAPKPGPGNQEIQLEYLGEMTMNQLTGGDIAPDGKSIIVKGYNQVWYYQRAEGAAIADTLKNVQPIVVGTYKVEPQGEAIAFAADGKGFFTLSEARRAKTVPLYFYPQK
jgi:hypothetical protein